MRKCGLVSSEPAIPPDLQAVLDLQLGTGSRTRAVRMRSLLTAVGRSRERPDELDPQVAALLKLIGLDPADPAQLARELTEVLEAGSEVGIGRDALPAVLQAYSRAVSRIVAAEAVVLRDTLLAVPAPERAELLERALAAMLPVGARGFDVLHRALLHEALLDALAFASVGDREPGLLSVGMVDLVGSTQYLKSAAPEALEVLVDILFEAAQSATAGRAAHVVKYVGDGVFLTGRDAVELAEVALELVSLLEAGLPLRARGGLAHGPVVERAGDLFGLPVNAAQILTKAARPGTVLAHDSVIGLLPAGLMARPRMVELPHPALGEARVATVRRVS